MAKLSRRNFLRWLWDGAIIWLPLVGRRWSMPVLPSTEQFFVFFVAATAGYNQTDGADIAPTIDGVSLLDDKVCGARGFFEIPRTGSWRITALMTPAATGDCDGGGSYLAGAAGENFAAHSGDTGEQVTALTALYVNAGPALTAALTAGYVAQLIYVRDATNIADTIAGSVYVLGFEARLL